MTRLSRTQVVKAIQYACALAAYVFLAYKLIRFNGYAELAAYFRSISLLDCGWLLAMLALLAVNIGIEAAKWRYIVSLIGKLSFAESLKSVLAGWVAAFVTPNRIGEIPGRSLFVYRQNDECVKSIVFGWIGSFASMLVTVLCGLPACVGLLQQQQIFRNPAVYPVCCAIILILLCLSTFRLPEIAAWLGRRRKWRESVRDVLAAVSQLHTGYIWKICGLSFLRYTVFCTQFWIMLRFFGISLSPFEAVIAIPAYYLFVTFTPSIGLSEPVIRGSWAIVALQTFTTDTAGVAFAAVAVWFINQVLPMLAGSLMRKG